MPTNSLEHREISNDAVVSALQNLPPGIEAGAQIDVRGRRWRLERAIVRDDCCELHVASPSGGSRRVFLWPFDRPAAVERQARLAVIRLRHWRRAIAAGHAREIAPWTPRARNVRADVLPYQLEPAIAMARGALRLVLADEVGLGKTVQAGWIVGDLVERERDARVLIAVPAGLRSQWRAELETLFGLSVVPFDAAWVRAAVSDLPADVSPWSAPGIYVGSIDFLKRPDVAPALESQLWDLLIVDEAHGSTAPTDRHAALAAIASRARRIVSITATPFSGEASRFESLIALGALSPDEPAPVMFRRSREDIGDRRSRRHAFVAVRITRTEFRLQRLLERYSRDVWREAAADAAGARLAVTILRKRALSSPAAAERSLRRRLALLQGAAAAPAQLSLFDEEENADDDLVESALAAPGLADAAREHRWLAAMSDAAAAAAQNDSKLRRLVRLLERTRGEAVIVFTEYRDTLHHLAAAFPRALQLHGGMDAGERGAVQRRFNEHGGCLLATDAAAEGLNLQQRCRLVVNYELPWNPARLEQRIGRVDRIGQRRPVHAITLIARDTAEDLVVANLTKRLARVAATLGERDRLASFLDETRVARSVIGAAATDYAADCATDCATDLATEYTEYTEYTDQVDRIDASAVEPPDLRGAAAQAAIEIGRRLDAACEWNGTPIASMRATAALPPGEAVVLCCSAQTSAGWIVSARVAIVHVAADESRPTRAEQARRRSAPAIERAVRCATDAVPGLREWFDDVQRAHAAAIDAHIAREGSVRDRRAAGVPVQPGLFDRRAVVAADRRAALDAAVRGAASERIRQLQQSRALRFVAAPAGVLVLWR